MRKQKWINTPSSSGSGCLQSGSRKSAGSVHHLTWDGWRSSLQPELQTEAKTCRKTTTLAVLLNGFGSKCWRFTSAYRRSCYCLKQSQERSSGGKKLSMGFHFQLNVSARAEYFQVSFICCLKMSLFLYVFFLFLLYSCLICCFLIR